MSEYWLDDDQDGRMSDMGWYGLALSCYDTCDIALFPSSHLRAPHPSLHWESWGATLPCYFHILHYFSSAKYENNMGEEVSWSCIILVTGLVYPAYNHRACPSVQQKVIFVRDATKQISARPDMLRHLFSNKRHLSSIICTNILARNHGIAH